MKSVYKYSLTYNGIDTIEMPVGSKIIHVDVQHGAVRLWVLINKEEKGVEKRIFRIYGTGHDIDDNLKLLHIGSCLTNEGTLVWHVFEEIS